MPWFQFAQYDASIEQPLIRNAGEALGVTALLNLSPDYAPDHSVRSSVALENLVRIEEMLRGPDPSSQKPIGFGGLKSPKWPSQIFPDDPAWKIDRPVYRGAGRPMPRSAPSATSDRSTIPSSTSNIRIKVFGPPTQWEQDPAALVFRAGPEGRRRHGHGPRAGQHSGMRSVQVPGFLKI